MQESTQTLQILFNHLKEVMKWRDENPDTDLSEGPRYDPAILQNTSIGKYIKISKSNYSHEEILVLLLALSPYLYAHLIREVTIESGSATFYLYAEIRPDGKNADPTGETAQFLIFGNNVEKRVTFFNLFDDNQLVKTSGLYLAGAPSGEPKMRGRLQIYEDELFGMLYGKPFIPRFSEEFPAQQISTSLAWEDLILPQETLDDIKGIRIWLDHKDTLLNDLQMKHKLKPGFRTLFYGPPGTGKTLAASLLGNQTNRTVFKVDLSLLVSKYIGETEKHLANLFDKAENKDWILFFDEADAIFGKRTNVKDSHDKYANQEVSFLLQKIESFPGMVILASNYKDNIDDAFMRRFQSVIKFDFPKPKERYQMWVKNLPAQLTIKEDINLRDIAGKYILNGSNIMNVIQDVSLKALDNGDRMISHQMMLDSIKKEYHKEDRVF
ncbi:ATP-binding protein [Aquimarina sp. 2201CG1-2-11]|uniref:ATP-binding protein n=1 Tax=Aquimarina discodermiae TaxID=3231043 RepID=UPI0034621929